MRIATTLALAFGAIAGCATAPAATKASTVPTQSMNAARTDGNAPLGLKLVRDEAGHPTGFVPAKEDDADLIVQLKISGKGASAKIFNRTRENVKLDMRISPDGETFSYTSSCPIPAQRDSFELWVEPIKVLEVSKPRVMDASGMRGCF